MGKGDGEKGYLIMGPNITEVFVIAARRCLLARLANVL